MQSENKWIRPRLQSVDRRLFETWDRDKLTRVRELVRSALESVEASGQVPETAEKVRAVLADIDAMFVGSPSRTPEDRSVGYPQWTERRDTTR